VNAALHYESSRGRSPAVAVSEAIRQGLAPDGGLYLPAVLPQVDMAALADGMLLPDVARRCLEGFFTGDRLQPAVGDIADAALNFPLPTTPIGEASTCLFALELYHGPTAAFKDVGARFLAESLARLEGGAGQPLTILVATSGDTGGAVAAAFHLRPWVHRHPVPEGPGKSTPGTATHLLGRQRDFVAHRRLVR